MLDLVSDWLKGSGVLEDDIKAINNFNRSQQKKSRREVRELCKWWLETFNPNGDCGVRLFSNALLHSIKFNYTRKHLKRKRA